MSNPKTPRVALFLANGCEEIEALTTPDILYRAGIPCDIVSITNDVRVTSSHKITVIADKTIGELDFDAYDMIILPGGVPGTPNLEACDLLTAHIREFAANGKYVAAICAAPSILAHMGLLTGRTATCNPCVDEDLVKAGVNLLHEPVVQDGNIITSRGMGTAIAFGLKILEVLKDKTAADTMADKILYSTITG